MSLRPNPDIEIHQLDGEIVSFDGERLNLLDSQATEVFLLLDGERSELDIATVIAERYGIDPMQIIIDVGVLLADFAGRRLLAG